MHPAAAERPNHVWSYDFVEERTMMDANSACSTSSTSSPTNVGHPGIAPAQVDRCHRCALRPVHPARRSRHIRSDNGPDSCQAGRSGSRVGARPPYIAPGSPWRNGSSRVLMPGCATSCSMARSSTRCERRRSSSKLRRHYNTVRHMHPSATGSGTGSVRASTRRWPAAQSRPAPRPSLAGAKTDLN